MKKIPFFTFKFMHPPLREAMTQSFQSFYDSERYVLGSGTAKFEEEWAAYCGTKHAITVADGLDALVIALEALAIGPGDEVIVPAHTYIATWLAVTQVGATLVPVACDPRTYNLDVNALESAISTHTKCIIPVNLYGQPCALTEIMAIANRHGIYVVEDNAQAQGATYDNKKTGSFGHVNAVSFYPGKNLGALGEGGAITTDDDGLADKVRALRNYGSHKKYHNLYIGRNARMDELQARLLSIKLAHLDEWNQQRQEIAKLYITGLKEINNIKLPVVVPRAVSVFHQFIVQLGERDDLQSYLEEAGVGTLIHYPIPPHLQPAYSDLGWGKGRFPIAEGLAEHVLSLPIYPGLKAVDVNYICEIIKRFYA